MFLGAALVSYVWGSGSLKKFSSHKLTEIVSSLSSTSAYERFYRNAVLSDDKENL